MALRWVFQQDNDPKHTAKVVKDWFDENNIKVMKQSAQQPDLNPIENLWGELKRALSKLPRPKNANELWENAKIAWVSIPVEKCQNQWILWGDDVTR